ncbi:MAG TPA: hypothetical protein VNZ94_12945 [Xanthobacteraceae bacterium]|nr:hypothetical protein [Xanthobacteraceae bacterium]
MSEQKPDPSIDDGRDASNAIVPGTSNRNGAEARSGGAAVDEAEIVVLRSHGREGDAHGGASHGWSGQANWAASHATIDHEQQSGGGWTPKIAVIVAAAALIGAVGGSLAMSGLNLVLTNDKAAAVAAASSAATSSEMKAMRETITRLNAEVASLKGEFDKAGKTRSAQIGKLGEQVGKLEKAQDDTASKLGKLAEAQEKDRRVAAAAANDVTGSITPVAKPDPRKPHVIPDWRLDRVSGGGALVAGSGGLYHVYPGDPLPGLGVVEAVRYEDGRWVVVTQKGLIVRR